MSKKTDNKKTEAKKGNKFAQFRRNNDKFLTEFDVAICGNREKSSIPFPTRQDHDMMAAYEKRNRKESERELKKRHAYYNKQFDGKKDSFQFIDTSRMLVLRNHVIAFFGVMPYTGDQLCHGGHRYGFDDFGSQMNRKIFAIVRTEKSMTNKTTLASLQNLPLLSQMSDIGSDGYYYNGKLIGSVMNIHLDAKRHCMVGDVYVFDVREFAKSIIREGRVSLGLVMKCVFDIGYKKFHGKTVDGFMSEIVGNNVGMTCTNRIGDTTIDKRVVALLRKRYGKAFAAEEKEEERKLEEMRKADCARCAAEPKKAEEPVACEAIAPKADEPAKKPTKKTAKKRSAK